jgi:hypothetical protein
MARIKDGLAALGIHQETIAGCSTCTAATYHRLAEP